MIVKAMKLRSDWKTQATALSKKAIEISSAITQWTLQDLEKEATSLTSRTSCHADQLAAIINHIKKSDTKRALFTDRPAKSCPSKLPTFGGQDHEDLITFKDKFNKAAENNKISPWPPGIIATFLGLFNFTLALHTDQTKYCVKTTGIYVCTKKCLVLPP